jgi:hypothetical protein
MNNFSLMENITVNGYVSDLAFSADGFYLKTNNGSFKLKSAVGVSYDENDCFLRLAIRRHWISRHRHKTIWLPQELRRHSSSTVPPWSTSLLLLLPLYHFCLMLYDNIQLEQDCLLY